MEEIHDASYEWHRVTLHLKKGEKSGIVFEKPTNRNTGATVNKVAAGSLAEKAGVRVGDALAQVNSENVSGKPSGHATKAVSKASRPTVFFGKKAPCAN